MLLRQTTFIAFILMAIQGGYSQNIVDRDLPYYQIPDTPERYTAGAVAARVLDGLGYRYYWATEGLTEEDLTYRPSPDGRTMSETLDHIYGLTKAVVNATKRLPIVRGQAQDELSFTDLRKATLENISTASDILKTTSDQDMESLNAVFVRGDRTSEFPFWNLLNGPVGDALWHTGQVVLLRRAAGNPLPEGVRFFTGKTVE